MNITFFNVYKYFGLGVSKDLKSWWRRREGGEGQRREEKVLKSVQDSEQLLILLW